MRVPTYDTFQASPTVGPTATYQGPSGPSAGQLGAQQLQDAGRAAQGAGSDAARIALDMQAEANRTRIADAMNQAVAARLDLTHGESGYTSLKGKSALERPDNQALDQEYGDRLKKTLYALRDGLGNDAQKQNFTLQAGQLLTQFRGDVTKHMVEQGRAYQVSTQAGTVKVAADQMALDWDKPDALAQGQGAIKAASAELGRLQGLSPEEVAAKTVEALSPAHAAVITTAIQSGRVDYAKAYMDQIKAELTPQARAQLSEHLKAGDTALQATRKADEIWLAAGPGSDRNAPVDLFALEKAAREAFKGDPVKAKATIGELRERAAAFNASQSEYHAASTTAVYKMIDQGVPMNRVRMSPAWQQLPGDQQHRIMLSLEQEAAARESRDAAREARQERQLLLHNGAAYLRYGDPEVLAGMSRTQVEALRPTFGLEGTQHLLQRWDGLQKADGKIEAKMDKQDFDHVADSLGLKPFAAKSEDDKRKLGELQYRVENLIGMAQSSKKAPLTREEKMELMRQELVRTVNVPTWFGASSDTVPVIQLTPDQAAKVAVPAADRAKIVEALKVMAARQPSNPAFAPTEDNVRRLYLRAQSPAAGLIPASK